MNRFSDIDVSFKRLPPVYGFRSAKLVSIEKALEPIVPQIDELNYYIKIAKKHCHCPSEHGLTHDESAAIYIYTMEWGDTTLYRVLNKALRSENRQELKIWFPYLKLFDMALDKLPTVKEVIWRGIPLDIGKSFTKNQVVTWWSVNSCSSSVSVIKSFLGNDKNSTLFLIEAVNGKKVSGYTEFENEDEIILPMGSRFCVKSDPLEKSDGSCIVHLIEFDDDNDHTSASATSNMSSPAISSHKKQQLFIPDLNIKQTWKQNGITVVGGNDYGSGLNQLFYPYGVYIDDDQTIYVGDSRNHRIVEWKSDATTGQVVAGGNGPGNGNNQLNNPTNVIVDKENDCLIICDVYNRRVIRWPRRNGTYGETIISNVDCGDVAMDNDGYLYVSDPDKYEVRRWKMGDNNGTVVAGGNGRGSRIDQLDGPYHIFVDQDRSVYVSEMMNHRVMKWMKDAKKGIVVAGGQGSGNGLKQLSNPSGVIVDQLGTVYVVDGSNHRVMRWLKGARKGSVVVGGNGRGEQPNQLYQPLDLSFDRQNNLYVVDYSKHRVQKFNID